MSKLIHSQNLASVKKNQKLYSSNAWTDLAKKSLIFTDDGYLVTHNHEFKFLDSILTDAANKILVSTVNGTSWIDAPTNGTASILKWNGQGFVWGADKNEVYYKLTINESEQGAINGISTYTSLGFIYAPTSSGTGIPSLSGTTWSWNEIVTTITDSAIGIPTVTAIKNYVTAGINGLQATLTGAFQYIKDVSADPTTTAPDAPEGGWKVGNVVGWDKKEYLYTDSGWREFGDEGSYALKTITITGTGALTGGGDLSTNRAIDMAEITVSNSKGTNNIVNGVTTDKYGRVTAVSYATAALTDTWKQNTKSVEGYVTAPGTTVTNVFWGIANTNGDPTWINLWTATDSVVGGIKLKNAPDTTDVTIAAKSKHAVKLDKSGYAYVDIPSLADYMGSQVGDTNKGVYWTGSAWAANSHTVDADVPSNAKFTDTNTWRPIYAWKADDLGKSGDTIDDLLDYGNTGVKKLAFSSTFGYKEGTSADIAEIDLVWAEVDSNGHITYSV